MTNTNRYCTDFRCAPDVADLIEAMNETIELKWRFKDE